MKQLVYWRRLLLMTILWLAVITTITTESLLKLARIPQQSNRQQHQQRVSRSNRTTSLIVMIVAISTWMICNLTTKRRNRNGPSYPFDSSFPLCQQGKSWCSSAALLTFSVLLSPSSLFYTNGLTADVAKMASSRTGWQVTWRRLWQYSSTLRKQWVV